MRHLIASFKLFFFGLLCLIIIPIQFFWQLIFRRSDLYFVVPKIFNRLTLFLFRIKVKIKGEEISKQNVIFVGNHLSYIDIPVLGGNLPAIFIAKADVRKWPVFGTLASISRTIYIERNRGAAMKCIQDIAKSIKDNRSLILFPEGTSTQGISVLTFKSSIFELFLDEKLKNNLILQPFTLTISSVDNHNILQPTDNDIYAWHSDMTLPPHLWGLALSKGANILLTLHKPLHAKDFADRKEFAAICHDIVEVELKKTLPKPLRQLSKPS